MIHSERIPCWYELTFRPVIGIVLRIHEDFVRAAKPIPRNSPIVAHFKEQLGFQKFGATFGKDFGYEHALKWLCQSGEFLEYRIPAALCRKVTDEKCRQCAGSGKRDTEDDETCLFCNGVCYEVRYDYKEAYAVSATLTTLFEYMRFPEVETLSPEPQLICVQTVTMQNQHGGSISGEYSEDVVNFLRNRNDRNIPEMVSAMRSVWEKMEGQLPKFYDHDFTAYTQGGNGWLNTSCPGSACGLHANHNSIDRHGGYEFSCHNADNPIQQLAMLGSLAALHDLVRPPKARI
jgi:hypothetical protein